MNHAYIHVPFCARRCSYCDFAIAVRRATPSAAFVDAILRERDLRRGDSWVDEPLETLYLGGGTPSRLDPVELARLVGAFRLRAGAEVTVEANPDDVTPEGAARWATAGVNRVSLGVQSFHPEVLAWMHRTHTVDQARQAVPLLRDAGIPSVSLDLIFGLPEELAYDFREDVRSAVDLDPDHLSVYGLTVEPRTPLARWIARGVATPGADDRGAAEFLLAHETLPDAGFEHYEVSNYARPGRRAHHNSAYWSGAAYGGLGPSAHGFAGGTRRWNLRDWVAWREAVEAGRDPIEGQERLTAEQLELERLYLGLRTSDGIAVSPSAEHPAPSPGEGRWAAAVQAGWLRRRGDRLVPTPEGWLRLDTLLPFLTTSPGGG